MSVPETFLRGGRPSTAVGTLRKTLMARYDDWCWVTVFPRQWFHDTRVNAVTAPSFHLLFGSNNTTDNTTAATSATVGPGRPADMDGWHLLFASAQSHGGGGGGGSATIDAVRSVFAAVDADLHPRGFSYVVYVPSGGSNVNGCGGVRAALPTHERLGLCGAADTEWLSARLAEKVLRPEHAARPVAGHLLFTDRVASFAAAHVRDVSDGGGVAWHARFDDPTTTNTPAAAGDDVKAGAPPQPAWLFDSDAGGTDTSPSSSSSVAVAVAVEELVSLAKAAAEWVRTSSGIDDGGATADCSIPSQAAEGGGELLRLVASGALDPLLWRARFVEPRTIESRLSAATTATSSRAVSAAATGPVSRSAGDLAGIARAMAERDAGRAEWKAAIGECTTFYIPPTSSLSSSSSEAVASSPLTTTAAVTAPVAAAAAIGSGTGAEGDYRYAFYLQRPHAEKKPIDMDNRDPGPCSPQPIAAELHLLPDPGDALHIAGQLLNDNNGAMDFTYEDYLQEEGEVLVQLAPLEGVGFDDIDRYLAILDDYATTTITNTTGGGGGGGGGDGGVGTATGDDCTQQQRQQQQSHRPVLCSGTCNGLVYPRVTVRRPTGRNERLNPMTKAHAQLAVTAPTQAAFALAVDALRLLSASVVDLPTFAASSFAKSDVGGGGVVDDDDGDVAVEKAVRRAFPGAGEVPGKPGYTLRGLPPIDVTPLGPASRHCGWCVRRRERLLRCGGCKSVYYCCKAHQAIDWKEGSHKTDCGLFKWGKAVEETIFAPLAVAVGCGEGEGEVAVPSSSTTRGEEGVAEEASDAGRCRASIGYSCAASLGDFLNATGVLPCHLSSISISSSSSSSGGDSAPQVHLVGVEEAWLPDVVAALPAQLLSRHNGNHDETSSNTSDTDGNQTRPQLRITIFIDKSGAGSNRKNESSNAVRSNEKSSTPGWANNTILAIHAPPPHPTATNTATTTAPMSGVVEVPATGVLGDLWHRKGGTADDNDNIASDPAAFAAARTAPILVRVCHVGYFHYIEGGGGGGGGAAAAAAAAADGRPANLRALMYVGPANGAGLGFLYGSLDTVARLVIAMPRLGSSGGGAAAVRFLDSSFVGAYRTAGALLARLDERRDAAGVAVRALLTARWNATAAAAAAAAKAKNASTAINSNMSAATAAAAATTAGELISLNSARFFALGSPVCRDKSAPTAAEEQAPFVNSFFFDVPARV